MRKELAKQAGDRKKFTATFVRLGKKAGYTGYSEETILLKDVVDVDTQKVVADHVWFSFTKGFQDARLTEGAKVSFEARVKEYTKGYLNRSAGIDKRRKDFRLSHPTRIVVLSS
ncbi:hypothetical protein [Chryseolinea lacunae]|uniref:Uncharacterized protein n=1 Tax=Chryseolinea lacunae TaxID=2801331 RepID=A0ABS1KU09_9BACT|nr:hypothetical protein [Chryseolinea lacunae]MBL0742953.1 hypothetical protein [Chryseolinea lacunae]